MADLSDLSVAQAAIKIRRKELSPVALVKNLLDRIDALEPSLFAWVTIDQEKVLEVACDLERMSESDRFLGPLHGVPVGIKDIFYTKGIKTTACSKVYADFVPTYDSTCVQRLKEAGAIILGKTVTTEFATGDASPSRNPWNTAHTPGGSSSGSAVAVAARMCPAALGSQTGGSVCRPAAYNGVVGFKPSYGRISKYGVIPVSWSLDTVGTLTRTVEDAAMMLGTLAGHDSNDSTSVLQPVPDYLEGLEQWRRPLRIGLIKEFFFEWSDKEVQEHTLSVVDQLASAGAEIKEISLPESFANVDAIRDIVDNVEVAAYHEELFREYAEDYTHKIRSRIEAGMLIPGIRYLQAQRMKSAYRRDMESLLDDIDILLTPATYSEAPKDLTTTGIALFQAPWTLCGLPTIALPSGLSNAGLPLAIQLVGKHLNESALLTAARWCEITLGVDLVPSVGGHLETAH